MRQSHNEEAPSHGNMSGKIRVSSGLHRMHQVTITHASLSEALTIFPPKLSYKTNTSMLLISSDATNTAQGIIKLTR